MTNKGHINGFKFGPLVREASQARTVKDIKERLRVVTEKLAPYIVHGQKQNSQSAKLTKEWFALNEELETKYGRKRLA